ncbi:MAG: putative membrane protein YvbJ [Verrucomicrobiales bacterium]|jgi:uncharacterized membrane protein YvbJ
MIPINWVCPKCGEELEPQFELCWNCGTSSDAPNKTPPENKEDAGDATERALKHILGKLARQQTSLDAISFKVGCLFAFLVVMIGIWIISMIIAHS